MAGYGVRAVSKILGLTATQVRSYVRAGFVAPDRGARGEYRFSFQDLLVLRTAQGLVAARIPSGRVRRALKRLREQLPEGRSLSGVHIAAEGDRIVVTEGVPIGYAQAAEVGLWAAERPAELAPGMWQVACFVTPATDRGGSLVPRVLSQLTEEVFATTLAVACAALVSIRNEAGARAYERAGFRWQRIWRDELLDPSWLMLKDRPK